MPLALGSPPALTRGLYEGQHAALGPVQSQPKVSEGTAEGHIGNVPYHDVLHSHPVLSEDRREALGLCSRWVGWPRALYPRALKKALKPAGTRAKRQGV